MASSKPKGLRLNLGGAPNTPHFIVGVPGVYRPTDPVPVGGDEDLVDSKRAKELHDDESVPLELVDIKASQVDELRDQAREDLRVHANAAREARKDAANDREADDTADALAAAGATTTEEGQ